MKPFLQEIAEYYVANHADALTDYCFVFPNKRSGVFFSHYLAREAARHSGSVLLPEITTISEFVTEIADTVEASRLEQLFILYHCYRKIAVEAAAGADEDVVIDFNKFRFWGEVILNDFTDVDKYMVDPEQLFHNIDTLKEISADYLSPEQIAVIERYWGADKVPPGISDFWRHVVHESESDSKSPRVSTTSFIKLWQILHPLYIEFNNALDARGLSYQGKTYRDALNILRDTSADDLPYFRYVFIGFNVLSTVEEDIFAALRDKNVADFFWDYVSPAFADDENRATRFLKEYVRKFPHPIDASGVGERLEEFPQIDVIALPAVEGQLKMTSRILQSTFPETNIDKANLLSTAIVLPDESLALPLIDSLPPYIREVNVTMGYPMRNTPVASLIASVITMQLKASRHKGEFTFFHEDVRAVLAHPFVRAISSDEADRIVKLLNDNRIFNVSVSLFESPHLTRLSPLFGTVVVSETTDNVIAFLENLCTWLLGEVMVHYKSTQVDEDADDPGDPGDRIVDNVTLTTAGAIEAGFLRHYLSALDELKRLRREHSDDLDVDLEEGTIFHLVERLLGSESVRFEGMPLKGLQVMGMLETRALDFDTVIIPSMNERIFPRRHFAKSFIPPALRAGYGMATIDHQESISAYYFYRLISRAKRVILLYDSRSSGMASGEPSRYINQLRYLYRPERLSFYTGSYRMTGSSEKSPFALTLSPSQRQVLRRYLDPASGRYLSASAINKFINCPVDFLLSVVEGYREDDEVKSFMDESTLGTVVHEVVEKLYRSQQLGDEPLIVDHHLIKILDNDRVIRKYVDRAINKHYLKLGDNLDAPLTGDADVMASIICQLVKLMLSHELDGLRRFRFISAEEEKVGVLTFPGGLKINFKYFIDRVDIPTFENGYEPYRIIDYKTGSDDTKASSVESLFDNTLEHRPKAILQLFLYANALAQLDPKVSPDTPIMPQIYRFRTIGANRTPDFLTIGNQTVLDYRSFNEEFMQIMEEKLNTLFGKLDSEEPIVLQASESEYSCKYCMFKTLCGRN
ncbi:MAG: PD-(D/E)XK nuclease family protein [Muribaculaceae bacterium]|nr:PD-(D/E)XK nuclease family protein [Muribaculaceae bacterium]